ncbi:cell division control protein 45 homolog [Penaeus monodon]|uniref:cell division control protein 45 homolog n=1 Tax=Penaeus monodon TaxID=6687 RepID=UPI0018A758AE|nr:cell division control protein 45 homolog [Penaeus monodon]XP_037802079.1 cell division control protein 45 homolog [Penaeus monodon]XP_037802080.1 cell division control protein 45 homolog [Penaeus monodon]
MLVSDLRKEFYDVIRGKRILVLAHFDIDGICASKILQSLFRTDHILYTVVPIKTRTDLINAYQQHAEQIKHIVLLNCGGCVDIVDILQPPEDIVFFVADNHRPLDICNIYNADQVRILTKLGDDEEVPAFDDIFREDESDEEEESDEEGGKRQRFDEAALERRRARRQWEQQRHKILFDYTQFSYYGSSTASLMFDIAWKLSKDSNELLWWAIVGESELLMSDRIEQDKYLLVAAELQNHVSRLNHKSQDEQPLDCLRITFEKELQLGLYRHWSLVESMRHSLYTATTLKLWTLKGEKRLHELLAEMGLPLSQCKQKYCGMDVALRKELQSLLESKAEKYGLDNLLFASFTLSHGFRSKYSASDYVYATLALLETSDDERTAADAFLDVSDSLSITKLSLLEKGIETSKQQLEAVYRQMQTFLDMNQVISAGPFLYATVIEGTPDAKFFSAPHCISLLARFTLRAHVAVSRSKKSRSLPLIITTPDVKTLESNMCLVCGIPPISEESPRNFFGKAFEQAADKTGSKAELEFFDTNIIRLSVDDRSKFFDALISLLS